MVPPQTYVTIGGRQYKTVTIGNQEWLAENLDYKFAYSGSTLPIGRSDAPKTPAAWYYDNYEATYGIEGTYKCGLLYNWYAAKYLNDNKSTLLPSGWHVPTNDEWDVLKNEIGAVTAGTKLKALDGSIATAWPSSWNGSDDYGFGGIPSGYRSSNKGFYDFGSSASYWTVTSTGVNYARGAELGNYAYLGGSESTKWGAYALRLVKDVT